MSFRSTFIAASIAIAAVPAAFAGPLSADGSPLTLDTQVASQNTREQVRSSVQTDAARTGVLISADGAPLTLTQEAATGVTRAQVQAEAQNNRASLRADSLPLIGLNG
jgi:hypothetical protein